MSRPTKLLFRADALHQRWFFVRTRIAWANLRTFSLDDRGLLLSLYDGRRHRIRVRVNAFPQAATVRDGIAHLISQTAGIHPDGGPILRVGDQEVTPFALADLSSAMVTSFDLGKRIARDRGADAVEPIDFVHALLVGPERSMLGTFGLDLSAIELDSKTDAYRGELVDRLSPSLEISTRRARLASGNRKQLLDPIDLLLELIRIGEPAAEKLVARGLVPMRIVDHRAHGLSPAESDARARKTLTARDLLVGIDASRVALVFVDDQYTPYVVVARLIEKHLGFGPAEANAFVRRVGDEGRAPYGSYEAKEGAALAIELMYAARRQGSPLLVELAPDRNERR
jgi:ATP-dependent Clp protease adapter protein ClpS